jgi:L-glutamine:2-deoxy-scyllo-inosose/3-amino-2,3-dideoxy-scyllo-inosose aminotransferase
MMSRLAISGGKPVRNARKNPWPKWPQFGEAERQSLSKVLDSAEWSYNAPMERKFNRGFKELIKTRYAISVANGTVSLQLALEALDIGYGDEVIVPGLTWQATAAAVIDVNAVPILVDVEPDTWCINAAEVEKAITPRTRAIIPVHLYGCIADMDAILKIAKKHKLAVIEDCAHQHGSVWKNKPVGSIGDIGSFSFQLSKLLTAGEGGALTTNSRDLFMRLDALRNCGRRPVIEEASDKGSGAYVSEGDFIQSGNYRISDFQAAILVEQLKRMPAQVKKRDRNAIYLNGLLDKIPGITPMKRDGRISLQSYYNFSFRYDAAGFKGLPVRQFRQAFAAELGITVEPSYVPLSDCPLYRPLTKKRYNINKSHFRRIDPSRFRLPVSNKAYREESVCFHHSVLMGTKKDMDQIADAIVKIRENADQLL